ncbi:phage tail tape measure protein [uncultured Acidaminococcus sp.]|uniref:phage tail tape measure protein n=1 Tax=uncultured Acidaminococcus sp. TaxID=352152 RepID=UPI00266636E3|nr:phage tail tape measure protein [uncultured Acidaminococcus sp.]
MAGQNMSVQILIGAAVASSLGSAFTSAANQVSSLQRQIKRMDGDTRQAVQAQMGLMKAFNQGTVSADTYSKAMKRLHDQIQLNKTTKGLMQGIAQDRQQFAQLDQQATVYMGKMMAWGATTKFLAGPIQSAMQFESVMADVRKVVDFDTPQQFKEMSDDILKLSQEIPVSASGLAQIMASAGQAGIARNELVAFTRDAAKMGVAFDITADQAGDMMAKWRTAFKMGQDQVVELADKVNYLGNKTAASAPAIADVVTRIGPLGSVGGVASGEIAAMGASIVGSGIASEVAATGIKNLILGLTAGESATKKQRAAFDELGLDSTQVAASMQKDAKGTILMVLDSISKLDKVQQAAVLKNLFGKESIGAIAPLLSNLDNLKRNMDLVSKPGYEGSMEKEYEERSKTTANAIQLLKNAMSSLAVTLGSSLLPYLAQGASWMANVAKAMSNWGKAHPTVVKGIYGLVVGAAAFMTAGMGIMMVVTRLHQAFVGVGMVIKGLRVAFTVLRGAMMLASAHPLVLGFMALIAVGYLVYSHWGQISAFFARMWEGGKAALANFTAWISAKFDAAYAFVMGLWRAVKAFFESMWEGAKGAVSSFVAYIQSKLSEAYDWVMDKWTAITDFLSHPITGTVNIVKNVMGGGSAPSVMPPGLASGGIFNQGAFLTSFAEDSPEAAIPIDGSLRARGLWAETGRRLGLMPSTRSGGGSVTVQYSPIVTISGSASKSDLESAMQLSQDRLKRMLREIQADQRRLAYD